MARTCARLRYDVGLCIVAQARSSSSQSRAQDSLTFPSFHRERIFGPPCNSFGLKFCREVGLDAPKVSSKFEANRWPGRASTGKTVSCLTLGDRVGPLTWAALPPRALFLGIFCLPCPLLTSFHLPAICAWVLGGVVCGEGWLLSAGGHSRHSSACKPRRSRHTVTFLPFCITHSFLNRFSCFYHRFKANFRPIQAIHSP